MQIIKKAKSSTQKLLGSQKIKDTDYRLMKYTLIQNKGDDLLLYNVITGELVSLNKEESELMGKLPCGPSEKYSELIEKYFLVPVDYDEKRTVGQLRKILSAMESKKEITGYTILPTTYCNARCFYCYECGYEHIHMSEETAHRAVDYMIEHSKEKKISIGWFGGEPLVGERIISLISKELTDKGKEFSSSMISNGALFDEELVKKAVDLWKLTNVQITIDGTEDIYNKVKDYISFKGSPYKRVLNNICLLSKAGIRVSIRINLGFHNEDDTEKLIEELSEYFREYENVSMYVHELFDNEGVNPKAYTEEENNHLTRRVIELNEYIEEKGKYKAGTGLPSLTIRHCMADGDGSVIIQPDGGLSKCEHYNEGDEFGNIYTGERVGEKLKEWKTYTELEKCGECPLYPSCRLIARCPDALKCNDERQNKNIKDARAAMLKDLDNKASKQDKCDPACEDDAGVNNEKC